MNAVGRRTGMTDPAGTESWTYDPMGRVAADQRTTNGVTKTTSYTYYLDGSLKTLTYPSGRVMTYQLGGAELPLSVTDGATTYAAGATYAPQGALAGLSLGGGNITFSATYNSRMQPGRMQAAAGGTDLLDLDYDFGLGTADNGNVMAIVNGRDNTRTQFFAYDALNRITLARTQASTGQTAWGQAFGYDPWGNLLNTTLTQGAAPSFSVTANAQNRIVGYCYDAAGNLLDPGTCNNPHSYTYNAEGQIVSAVAGAYTYTYDGDGKRVEKSNGKLYWYGAGSDALAESDASGNITDEYVFFGGKRVARRDAAGNVDYYLADQLGSSRVVTDSTGNVLDDCDYYPFGWDNCVSSGSGNTYKFTGKERDSESGLDNFGARHYSSALGRFMSVDPNNLGALEEDAQTWNAYAYVRNNPTALTDPEGSDFRVCIDTEDGGQNCLQDLSNEQFEQLVYENNGTWVSFQNGQISVTLGGESTVIGSFEYFVGPKSEGGSIEDATLDLLNFVGGVEGGVKGVVSISEGLSAFMKTFAETGAAGQAKRLLPFGEELSGRVAKAMDAAKAGIQRYPKDGIIFENREGLLPGKPYGYYHEYTVDPVSGVSGRGAERIVEGLGGEIYYTPIHYKAFVRVQ